MELIIVSSIIFGNVGFCIGLMVARNQANDKIEGLEADLDSAVEVAYKRGATEWAKSNYPNHIIHNNGTSKA